MAGELHGQVTREAAGILDEHHANAVSLAVIQQLGEAWARRNRISAASVGADKDSQRRQMDAVAAYAKARHVLVTPSGGRCPASGPLIQN